MVSSEPDHKHYLKAESALVGIIVFILFFIAFQCGWL
jgi:hypothetical protein